MDLDLSARRPQQRGISRAVPRTRPVSADPLGRYQPEARFHPPLGGASHISSSAFEGGFHLIFPCCLDGSSTFFKYEPTRPLLDHRSSTARHAFILSASNGRSRSNRRSLRVTGFKPSLPVLALDNEWHPVMPRRLIHKFVRFFGDNRERFHLALAIWRAPTTPYTRANGESSFIAKT